MLGTSPGDSVTAVVYVTRGGPLTNTNPLYKLIRNISKSQFVARVSQKKIIISLIKIGYFKRRKKKKKNSRFFNKKIKFNLHFEETKVRTDEGQMVWVPTRPFIFVNSGPFSDFNNLGTNPVCRSKNFDISILDLAGNHRFTLVYNMPRRIYFKILLLIPRF